MASREFALIDKYFARPTQRAVLGVGDDAALIAVTEGCELAVSTDTLVAGVHFFADVAPAALGHKALAVNLSDLAAMGAAPRYATLALTLPAVDELWLAAFADGFHALADAHGLELIGGDTTRGPLSMTITVMGEVPRGRALRRDGARAGDDVYVTGTLGGAALALRHLQGRLVLPHEEMQAALPRLTRPEPRSQIGQALRGTASAMIDVSDGLLADLGHIAQRSAVEARVQWRAVPLHPSLRAATEEDRRGCALAGGDDYELCFTAPPTAQAEIMRIAGESGTPIARIGECTAPSGGVPRAIALDEHGAVIALPSSGFDHFET